MTMTFSRNVPGSLRKDGLPGPANFYDTNDNVSIFRMRGLAGPEIGPARMPLDTRVHSAVNGDFGSGDEIGLIRAQKQGKIGNVCWDAFAAHWRRF
jgi:hypothetical protein